MSQLRAQNPALYDTIANAYLSKKRKEAQAAEAQAYSNGTSKKIAQETRNAPPPQQAYNPYNKPMPTPDPFNAFQQQYNAQFKDYLLTAVNHYESSKNMSKVKKPRTANKIGKGKKRKSPTQEKAKASYSKSPKAGKGKTVKGKGKTKGKKRRTFTKDDYDEHE